jgi:hypothetical protein
MKIFEKQHILWGVLFFLFAFFSVPKSFALAVAAAFSLWAFLRFRMDQILKTGIGLCFLPAEIGVWAFHLVLLQVLLVFLVKQRVRLDRATRLLGLWVCWCAVSYVLSQRIETNLPAFWLFLATFGSSLLAFFIAANSGISSDSCRSVLGFFFGCLVLQGLIIALFALRNLLESGQITPSDWAFGSTYISLPILTVAGLLYLLTPRLMSALFPKTRIRAQKIGFKGLLLTGCAFCMLVLISSNVVNYSAILAVGFGLGLPVFFVSLHRRLRLGWVITIGVFLAAGSFVGSWMLIYHLYGPTYLERWVVGGVGPGGVGINHKYIFLTRALHDIPEQYGTWLTGTGPGTVGSRASNIRAYDTMYKDPNRLDYTSKIMSAHTSLPARRYFSDLYQETFAKAAKYRSASLSQPFSSLISLFVELGIVGLLLFGSFLWCLMRVSIMNAASHPDPFFRRLSLMFYFLTLCLLSISVFDTYFERPTVMTVYWIFAGLVVQGARKGQNDRKSTPGFSTI